MRQTPTPGCRHSTNIRLALGTFRRWLRPIADFFPPRTRARPRPGESRRWRCRRVRSEEHTSELQSRLHLVCRLLLEKKKKKKIHTCGRPRSCYVCPWRTHVVHFAACYADPGLDHSTSTGGQHVCRLSQSVQPRLWRHSPAVVDARLAVSMYSL